MAAAGKTGIFLAMAAVPLRFYLALVFVTAGWGKIAAPHDFALSVATYQILPLALVNAFSIVVPWMEVLAGALLFFGFWTKPSSLVIFGLLSMFTTALIIALAKGLDIDCGCFASADAAEEIGYATLVRDLIWLFIAIFLLLCDTGRFAVDGLLRRELKNA